MMFRLCNRLTKWAERLDKRWFSSDSARDDLLSRTKIITDEKECSEVISHMLHRKAPIAVDTEGVQLPTLGLIQVRTEDRNVYLFRTGRNRSLLTKGRLKELMESPDVLKVMHACSGDILAVYKEGIRLWNLYDTALAHKVIQYQDHGSALNQPTIGFNSACSAYGLESNPLKQTTHRTIWIKENDFIHKKVLDEDLVYYSAFDVEPLLDLYYITSAMIHPDYEPILQRLCDSEIIRAIDPDAGKFFREEVKAIEQNSVFLEEHNREVNKAYIYEAVRNIEGPKSVYTNGQSSIIQFHDRKSALDGCCALQNQGQQLGSKPEKVGLILARFVQS